MGDDLEKSFEDEYLEQEKHHFWFVARRELIDGLCKKILKNKSKILEVGCFSGENMDILKKYGDVYGVDNSRKAIQKAKEKGLNVFLADATKLPFKDSTFDIVLMLDILEHLKDDGKTINEARRVLKEDGILMITVPAFKWLWGEHDEVNKHLRRYSKKDILTLINGFKLLRCSFWNFFLLPPIYLIRILPKSKKPKSDLSRSPSFLNTILLAILRLENIFILSGLDLPIGVSLITIAKKESK